MNFTPEQWRIISVNIVGVINLFFLCSTYVATNRRAFLLMQGLSPVLLVLMYALSGLWISVISTVAMMLRNLYNAYPRPINAALACLTRRGTAGAKEEPSILINMLLLASMTALSIAIGGGMSRVNPNLTLTELIVEYLPLVSLIGCSLAIFFVKSYAALMTIFFIDSVLWAVYDLRYMVVMALVADLISIVMTIVKGLLARFN